MRSVALNLMIMGCVTAAHAMESPVRSEMNECSGSSNSSESPTRLKDLSQQSPGEVESPPYFTLDASIQKEDSQETLLEMAERGVSCYTKNDPAASFYFTTILQQKDEKKAANPKSVALAHYYLGKMGMRGEAQAMIKKARACYVQGISESNNNMLENAIAGCYQVINQGYDEVSVLAAKLLLSDAAEFGNGMKCNGDVALQYAQDVAHQQKYVRESLKGCLQCAWLYLEGNENQASNFEHFGYAQAYLVRPRRQSQFEDLRSKAETLYARLQAKLQEYQYQEGLAYIRRAISGNGSCGAGAFWDRAGKKNIRTLQELKAKYPADYEHALNQAEHCFEQAAYDDSNPEIRDAARSKLGLIYKVTGRPNKFEEFQKARQKAIQAAATNQ